ncbi:MAG: FemAB family XrtA/PEP-CTERM system-associated protein [Solirubrobacterales bacterium]
MALVIKSLDDGSVVAWDRFVDSCPEATFFHRAGWRRVITASFRQKARFLYAEQDGAIVGVLPLVHMRSPLFGNRIVSTAFTVGGGVAAVEDAAREALDAAAVELMNRTGAAYVEYRQPPRPHPEGSGWVARPGMYVTFERSIPVREEDDWKLIPGKKRRMVRKAIDAGLEAVEDRHPGRFFPVYAEAMRDLGTPVFGSALFTNLMTEFGHDCECLIATHEGRPVAAALNFVFKNRIIQYFLGNLPEARPLGATNFLLWRMSRRAAERGLTLFDYGRSKVDSGNYTFKVESGFSPRPIANEFHLRQGTPMPELHVRNRKFSPFIAAWKRLPLPVANTLGPRVIRHIG